ncbi:MAG: alanine:cation symporter family protein [Synergistaceae bacterium]|jgi:AGCS family alanine or glycine:cation symporter|nr:alanine:cation symporter family protein [Synergistaceae bacterium]
MEKEQSLLMSFFTACNGVLWGWLMIWLLLGTGVYYSIRLGFPQFRYFFYMFKVTLGGVRGEKKGGITSFQALCTGLAAQVGTGNLAGVASALVSGGPGAIFWMWMTALAGMGTIMAEAILGQVFRVSKGDGTYRGGPAYYIERGLGQRWMGILFAFSITVSMALIFNAVQTNSIAAAASGAFGADKALVAAVVMALTGLVIFGGLKRIARVAEIVVPVMALLYILVALYVVITHITLLPSILHLIVTSAFGVRPVAGGMLGYTVAMAFRYGVARGLFSNEAGMGSTPNANATAEVNHPARQGFVAMMGVFVDTILICTATAAIILLSGEIGSGKTGIELTQLALRASIGEIGPTLITIALAFFAWTSILGNYYYGESNLGYIFPGFGGMALLIFRFIVLGMLLFGALSDVPLVWEMADFFNGIMALVNLVAILLLSGVACKVYSDYVKRHKAGESDPKVDPEFLKGFSKQKGV